MKLPLYKVLSFFLIYNTGLHIQLWFFGQGTPVRVLKVLWRTLIHTLLLSFLQFKLLYFKENTTDSAKYWLLRPVLLRLPKFPHKAHLTCFTLLRWRSMGGHFHSTFIQENALLMISEAQAARKSGEERGTSTQKFCSGTPETQTSLYTQMLLCKTHNTAYLSSMSTLMGKMGTFALEFYSEFMNSFDQVATTTKMQYTINTLRIIFRSHVLKI